MKDSMSNSLVVSHRYGVNEYPPQGFKHKTENSAFYALQVWAEYEALIKHLPAELKTKEMLHAFGPILRGMVAWHQCEKGLFSLIDSIELNIPTFVMGANGGTNSSGSAKLGKTQGNESLLLFMKAFRRIVSVIVELKMPSNPLSVMAVCSMHGVDAGASLTWDIIKRWEIAHYLFTIGDPMTRKPSEVAVSIRKLMNGMMPKLILGTNNMRFDGVSYFYMLSKRSEWKNFESNSTSRDLDNISGGDNTPVISAVIEDIFWMLLEHSLTSKPKELIVYTRDLISMDPVLGRWREIGSSVHADKGLWGITAPVLNMSDVTLIPDREFAGERGHAAYFAWWESVMKNVLKDEVETRNFKDGKEYFINQVDEIKIKFDGSRKFTVL